MKIKDTHTGVVYEFTGTQIEILADDGINTLYHLDDQPEGMHVFAGDGLCKHGGFVRDVTLQITPISCNAVSIQREVYQ